MKRFIILIFSIPVMVAMFISCEDTTTNSISNIDKIIFPESNISYYRTIQPLFNIGCAIDGCHDVKTKAANLDLSDYLGLKQRFYDVVIVRDTSKSRLIWSIEGQFGSSPMPPQRSLTANQIRGFKKWIMEGATDTIR
ncbi:MAG TPA: hypothetical protein DCQ28_06395 [Bacteroidetes bacterium]|nr:hypothetical protein [Bacteroidota bacterium]